MLPSKHMYTYLTRNVGTTHVRWFDWYFAHTQLHCSCKVGLLMLRTQTLAQRMYIDLINATVTCPCTTHVHRLDAALANARAADVHRRSKKQSFQGTQNTFQRYTVIKNNHSMLRAMKHAGCRRPEHICITNVRGRCAQTPNWSANACTEKWPNPHRRSWSQLATWHFALHLWKTIGWLESSAPRLSLWIGAAANNKPERLELLEFETARSNAPPLFCANGKEDGMSYCNAKPVAPSVTALQFLHSAKPIPEASARMPLLLSPSRAAPLIPEVGVTDGQSEVSAAPAKRIGAPRNTCTAQAPKHQREGRGPGDRPTRDSILKHVSRMVLSIHVLCNEISPRL